MKHFVVITIFIVSTLLNANKAFAFTDSLTQSHVLILNAYHQNYHWADEIMNGVFSVFDNKLETELYVEYMDTKRRSDSAYYEQLANIYQHKYQNVHIDVIIACDDNALNFLLQYRDTIFPGVPVSFCGIVDFHPTRLDGQKNYTGVYESFDIPANLDLIKQLHPKFNEIAVVCDLTESGRALMARLKRTEKKYNDTFKFTYFLNPDPEKLQSDLKNLSDSSIVIYAIYLRLPNGRFISTYESIQYITTSTSRPVYCIWDVVGQGVIGGKITTPFFQGESAAKKAQEILNGMAADSIAITGSPMIYKFDYKTLNQHSINHSYLPPNSVIINKPFSFWNKYKKLIISVVFIILILTLMVFILLFLYRKSKHAELEISKQNNKLQEISNTLQETNVQLTKSKLKAEESDRLKAGFLASLSHEIRTPVNGIVGFTSLIKEDKQGDISLEYLDIISSSALRLVDIIDDMVMASKLNTGEVKAEKHELFINELLDAIYGSFCPQIKRKNGVEFKLRKAKEIGLVSAPLICDKIKLQIIFIHLLKNSLKFTTSGHIAFGIYDENPLVFFVKDTGKGIRSTDAPLIFDYFTQGKHNPISAEIDGVGLGLSIVKGLVDLLNGKIWFESEFGAGTTFYFTIQTEIKYS